MSDGSAEAYVAGDAGPGVLLYQDAIGLRPQIERIADRIASWGHVVMAPNVFWRDGRAVDLAPTGDLNDPESRQAFFASGVMDRVHRLTPEIVRADGERWLAALHGLPGIAGRTVGATGYCFGGLAALRLAAHRPDEVAAIGLFHTGGIVTGDPGSPHLELPGIRAAVLAGHADNDSSNTSEQIAAFDTALQAAGIDYRTAVYPGAVHGYTMADTAAYQEEGAERHYRELRELFARTLTA
ncbi:dienelactone hydrolase family protein [Nocardia jinanensis]|uniref:Dienelactone hydrolase n=1 Tax=Nocardia jinanensis TaxID=382504 RepID=A0A917RDY9_9NOCA|nr:dienelactone hydrolase family protein [Nocardia jinanensis]GGL01764.1 putative dienelactone hydrolase [Nocardia jinanensis]